MLKDTQFLAQIGVFLKKAREREGVSIRGLAEYVGVAPNTIIRIERGENSLSVEHMLAICQRLGVTPALVPGLGGSTASGEAKATPAVAAVNEGGEVVRHNKNPHAGTRIWVVWNTSALEVARGTNVLFDATVKPGIGDLALVSKGGTWLIGRFVDLATGLKGLELTTGETMVWKDGGQSTVLGTATDFHKRRG